MALSETTGAKSSKVVRKVEHTIVRPASHAYPRLAADVTKSREQMLRTASVPTRGGLSIANATVSDNAYAHFGDNVYNFLSLPDTRKHKLTTLIESLKFTRMGARERNIANAISNTCDWLFADVQFCAWAYNEDVHQHHGIFWIKGKPGTGKSTLMKRAISWAKMRWPHEIVLSYFFNGRVSSEDEQTPLGVYRTLLYQLLSSLPHLHDFFLATFSAKERDGKLEPWEETELQNFLLESVRPEYTESLMIFIDAMDEGHDADVERLVCFLDELASRAMLANVQLRICLSSRHYPQIDLPHSMSIVLEHEAGHIHDIETYIRSSSPLGEVAMDDLRHHILQRSQGIFLWVALVIPLLKAAHRKGQGATAMLKTLEGVPEDLHELFASLLSRDPDTLDECMTMLRWILYSFETLTPDMLCAAIACTHPSVTEHEISSDADRQERYLLNTSRGLIESTEDFQDTFESFSVADSDEGNAWLEDNVSQTVLFIHQTVVDYLLSTYDLESTSTQAEISQLEDTSLRSPVCHAKLAQICLKYLTHLSTTTSLTPDTLKAWPLAPYAAKFWWRHVAMSGSACDQSLVDLAAKFLLDEQTRQIWVQLYDIDQPTDLSSAELFCWGRKVLKPSSSLDHRLGPSYYAVMLELPKVVEAVMLAKPFADVWDEQWGNALQVACSKQLWDLAERILNLGVDPNARLGRRHDGTPLQLASIYGNERVVQVLIDHGAHVDVSSARLATPLQEASRKGHHVVVQKLIFAGADLDQGFEVGDNALIRAFEAAHDDVVQALLSAGAGMGSEWDHKWPLLLRALRDERASAIRKLVSAGLPISTLHFHTNFEIALEDYVAQGDPQGLAALCATGPDAFGTVWRGLAAGMLLKAVRNSNMATIEALITAGLCLDAWDLRDLDVPPDALEAASSQGYEETVKFFCVFDIKSVSPDSRLRALRGAAKGRHKRVAKYFLETGVTSFTDLFPDHFGGHYIDKSPDHCIHEYSTEHWILDQVMDTDAAVRSELIRELFTDAVHYANSYSPDTTPLEFLTGHWMNPHDPASILRFVDEATAHVVRSSHDYRANLRMRNIESLWYIPGVDPGWRHTGMQRALLDAAGRGHIAVTNLLIAYGIDPNARAWPDRDSYSEGNPLCAAASGGHVKIVELLIAHGAVLSQAHLCELVYGYHDAANMSRIDRLSRADLTDVDDASLAGEMGIPDPLVTITIMRKLLAALQK